ncbi:iron dicitrate transporter FecR [Spirochaetia bacterium]|nr:iron dicitrate transporter FecR [Spirochaetia bacterium]
MKKMVSIALFICVLAAAQAPHLAAAVIQELSGKVEVKAPGGDWVPAEKGQRIDNATLIGTGFKAKAVIALGNSLLTVQPLTRLSLQELQELQETAGDETVVLTLQTGRVRADVNPPAGGKIDFTVRGPSATASVRGTTFEVDGTQLAVAEGRVRLTGGDRTAVYVSAGHQVTTNAATGKTPGVVETTLAELVPAAPAGVETGSTANNATVPVEPVIDIGGGITW